MLCFFDGSRSRATGRWSQSKPPWSHYFCVACFSRTHRNSFLHCCLILITIVCSGGTKGAWGNLLPTTPTPSEEKNQTRQLQNIYACTSPPVYLWCWSEQACRSHVCIVDAPHQRKASGCHVCLGKAGPSYINRGPWPPYPCPMGPNYMFEHLWSQLAAMVANKKQAI